MSYEHGTPFVNLPQTVGTDPRDWFDTNEAFADLDAKLKTAYEGAEGATQDIEAVKADILNLEQADTQMTARVDGIDSRVGANEQGISRLTGEIADVDTDLKDSICAIEEASATAAYQHLIGEFFWYNDTLYKATTNIAIGQQIVPDTNCQTTNITTELLAGGGGSGVEIDDSTTSLTKVWSSQKTNNELNTKAPSSDVYVKSEVYTKAEVDALLAQIGGSMKCVKFGSLLVPAGGTSVDISDLNFTSAEDYMVVINGDSFVGSGAGFLSAGILTAKTATSFTIGSSLSADFGCSYQVISFVD